jgi:hypothetical protein
MTKLTEENPKLLICRLQCGEMTKQNLFHNNNPIKVDDSVEKIRSTYETQIKDNKAPKDLQ